MLTKAVKIWPKAKIKWKSKSKSLFAYWIRFAWGSKKKSMRCICDPHRILIDGLGRNTCRQAGESNITAKLLENSLKILSFIVRMIFKINLLFWCILNFKVLFITTSNLWEFQTKNKPKQKNNIWLKIMIFHILGLITIFMH